MLPLILSFASLAALGLSLIAQAPRQPAELTPAPAKESDLRIRLDLVGRMPTTNNPTSPAVAGSQLLLIDQSGYLYRWNEGTAAALITPKTLPPGVRLLGNEALLNVAADRGGDKVYVLFASATVPRDVPRQLSPREPDGWYVLFEYQFDGTTVSAPRPLTAWQMRSEGHLGGGLVVLNDGSVLVAIGDNGDSYEDGRGHGQDPKVHLAKLVRVVPATGATSIVGLGVRAPQRLVLETIRGEQWLTFVDPGGWVSEELNAIAVDALTNGSSPPNFGWGRSAKDGKAREGTFFIDSIGNSVADAPAGEAGFVEPIGQIGRQRQEPFAISGPVHSRTSFTRITALFADLISGRFYAITGPISTPRQDVSLVSVAGDTRFEPGTGAANERPNPRFFNFPDGAAGVLLERTGDFYRIAETP
jgi:hypothetical protein